MTDEEMAEEDKKKRDALVGQRVRFTPSHVPEAVALENNIQGVVICGYVDPSDFPMVWVAWFPAPSAPDVAPEVDLNYCADLRVVENPEAPAETGER